MKKIILTLFLFCCSTTCFSSVEVKRSYMLKLALEQSKKMSGYWDPTQRDCSGFVRFLFRTTIFGKDDSWLDMKGKKVDYLGAGELIGHNFEELPGKRDFSNLKTGDVFVFYQNQKGPKDAWHLMVYLEPPRGVQKKGMLIYHNGQSENEGRVNKVWLSDLRSEVSGVWRPHPQNKIFKGVYRWKGFKNKESRL